MRKRTWVVCLLLVIGSVVTLGQPRNDFSERVRIDVDGRVHIVPYERRSWGSWATSDGCSTRARVLRRDDEDGGPCGTRAGWWRDPYSGQTWRSAADLQIDHIVAVSEAYRSGGWKWNRSTRRAFYNDTLNLIPVESSLNQEKSGLDAAGWMPPINRCMFARVVLDVKRRWELSLDVDEFYALHAALGTCSEVQEDLGGYPTR
jgi:hypothetical protein